MISIPLIFQDQCLTVVAIDGDVNEAVIVQVSEGGSSGSDGNFERGSTLLGNILKMPACIS